MINILISLKTKQILLLGDTITIPTDITDQEVLAEAWKSSQWLPPQQTHIKDSLLYLKNSSSKPIIPKGDKANPIKLTSLKMVDCTQTQTQSQESTYLSASTQPREFTYLSAFTESSKPPPRSDSETIDTINLENTQDNVKDLLRAAHVQYRRVFSKDLMGGYSGYYGKHICRLNWASSQ